MLRAFRLLRIFRLARTWKELNRIVTAMIKSVMSVSYLSLILLLFLFIFALLGMQLFGYKFSVCGVEDADLVCPPGKCNGASASGICLQLADHIGMQAATVAATWILTKPCRAKRAACRSLPFLLLYLHLTPMLRCCRRGCQRPLPGPLSLLCQM